jgi:hypothetical protein
MRTTVENREVETSGLQEAKTFTFAAGAKAFKIFIDGIYSDKIRAIVREYWTNAYDAHILVGKGDVPFNCQLPNFLNPELIIRDFGPSVPHDRMMRDFTQAFLSSKDNSDDFVGALGLGRLSAFSYTDSFNVNTYIAKEKRSYVVFLNSGNIPELSLMSVTPTDEEDGFEVRFPVKTNDYVKFWRAAEFTSIGFVVKPVMMNDSIKYPEAVASGDTWSIYPFLSGVHAKQGCVIYPIDENIVNELGDFEAILSTKGLVIDYPIGSLDFSASREALGYNEQTRENLKKSFTGMFAKMVEDASQKISKAKTWAEAAAIIYELKSGGLHKSIIQNLMFNGKVIETRREIENETLKDHKVFLYAHSPKYSAKKFTLEYAPKVHFEPAKGSIVYAAKRGIPSITPRVVAHMRQVDGNYVYIIHYDDARGLERMRRIMGYPEVIDVASLPKPKVAPRKKKDAAKQGYVHCFLPTEGGTFHEGEVYIKDGGVYLTIERGIFEIFSGYVLSDLCSELKKIGDHTLEDLVAINPSQVERFEKNGWIEATSLIRDTVHRVYNTLDNQHTLFCSAAHTSNYAIGDVDILEKADFPNLLGKDHLFTKCVESSVALSAIIRASSGTNVKRIAIMSSTKILPVEPPELIEQKKLIVQLHECFPMLSLIENISHIFSEKGYWGYSEEKQKILLDYLKKEEYIEHKLALAA